MISVFTPTFNRQYLLQRLYESLLNQIYPNFEWIIIDDESSDNTEETVSEFIDENHLTIHYEKVKHGGKHRAINRAIQIAKGELFFIVDSDDILPPDALPRIIVYYEQIKDDPSFAGVCGLKADIKTHSPVHQQTFPQHVVDTSPLKILYQYHLNGDKAEVFKTEVLRQYPFPEYPGEFFCTESLVWFRISQKYVLRYFNEIIYMADYQESGLTATRKSGVLPANSLYVYFNELLQYDIPLKDKFKAAINLSRFFFHLRQQNASRTVPILWCWSIPLGFIRYIQDKRQGRVLCPSGTK